MSEPKKPQRRVWPIPSAPSKPAEPKKSDAEGAGRVVHDARGNAVWDWSRAATDTTTHLLRKLDSPDLSLADDAAGKDPGAPADPGRGLDPYNKRNDQQTPPPRAGAPSKEPERRAPKDSVLKQLLGKR